ncbi:MAG: DUF1080 domain-containing protein, partial [candidate division KSB1 bacterium]|nr:DUF1080 domain-containing protein [candidate division KSB1 bacterium]
PKSWKIENGALVTSGPRSHLFYVGPVNGARFKNFEFYAEVMTTPNSNSGIYIHTAWQAKGWPSKGYECQIINSTPAPEPGKYVERKMTGSIYAVRNVWKSPAQDNEWFSYRIVVQGKTIRTYINDDLIAEYTESVDPWRPKGMEGRRLSAGTFALQCHDPDSRVYFRNLRVKPLPDDLPTPGKALEDRALDSLLTDLAARNFPLMDLHVHLKGSLTLDEALARARFFGFTYGIAVNCGVKMGIENEEQLTRFLAEYKKPSATFLAMQAEGREWLELFSESSIAEFDYVFTDAMTWTDDRGRRMRLWIPEETFIDDPQHFMDQLVDRIVSILANEPIDIYVNPTYLPDALMPQYDQLWTPERMDRVIQALVENQVALEINDRYRIPSATFIKRAKAAGVKFTFGTNNGGKDDLGRLAYCLQMIRECDLKPEDMWMP